jgi:hypothetical protein
MGMMLKNDVNHIKLLTPTKLIEPSAEASCIHFETEQSWDNFKFLLSQRIFNFKNSLKERLFELKIARGKVKMKHKHIT